MILLHIHVFTISNIVILSLDEITNFTEISFNVYGLCFGYKTICLNHELIGILLRNVIMQYVYNNAIGKGTPVYGDSIY